MVQLGDELDDLVQLAVVTAPPQQVHLVEEVEVVARFEGVRHPVPLQAVAQAQHFLEQAEHVGEELLVVDLLLVEHPLF